MGFFCVLPYNKCHAEPSPWQSSAKPATLQTPSAPALGSRPAKAPVRKRNVFFCKKHQVFLILEKSLARPSSAPPSSKTLALPRRMRRTGTRPGTPPGRGAWMTGAPLSMPSSPDRSSERRSSSACMPGGRWTRPSGLRSPVSSPRGARSRRSLRRLSKALQPWLPRSRVGTPS